MAEASIAFFGLAERAIQERDLGTEIPKWNVLGLKRILLLPFVPQKLSGISLALAIKHASNNGRIELRIKGPNGNELGFLRVGLEAIRFEADQRPQIDRQMSFAPVELDAGWQLFFAPMRGEFLLEHFGTYAVTQRLADGTDLAVGNFIVTQINYPPLTPERIAAIKSDPSAVKAVRATFGCKKCPSALRVYSALEKSERLESEGYEWAPSIPDRFNCSCGASSLDLVHVKRNFHALLGTRGGRGEEAEIDMLPLYERSALETVRIEFLELLDRAKNEEQIQQFIAANPILLHQFPAERIFLKPAILTKYKADFGILTSRRELIFVELEAASIRLLKKDGHEAAPLTHAIDQVKDWLHATDEHRLAVLASLNISPELVGSVRGAVIAGRDRGYEAESLRRLKGADRGRVSLLTYDDLAYGLNSIIRDMRTL